MRVAVVINSSAGGVLGRQEAEREVAEHLAAVGIEALLIPRKGEGDLSARIDDAIARGADAVVVGGGDGTIACAAQRLAGTEVALGILPLGTMNQLARDLGIPLDLAAAADSLAHGEVRAIDVAEVNGHVFLCNSVLGLPSSLSRHRERHRGHASLRTHLSFVVAALRSLWSYRPMRLDIVLGEGFPPRRVWTRALAVSNNAYDEGFGLVMRRARLDGGELVLYVANRFGVWWAMRMLAAMWLGAWRHNHRLLHERHTTSLEIHSRRRHLRVMNDGEAMLIAPPLHYRIRPLALRVVLPRPPEHAPPATAPAAAQRTEG